MNLANPDPLEEWRAALNSGRLHHAWLLTGAPSSGKAQFAMSAAAELVGTTVDALSQHPDILRLRRLPKDAAEARKAEEGKPFEQKRSITVAQVREMQQRFSTRPTLGDKRAIIVDPADDLEPAASNALLKTLEEPPDGTVFLLIAHQPGKLLATIRSRCRIVRFVRTRPQRLGAVAEHDIAASVDGLMKGEGDAAFLAQQPSSGGLSAGQSGVQLVCEIAQERLANLAAASTPHQFRKIDQAYSELRRLERELATYNYDADLMTLRLATLLKGVAAPID